MTPDTLPDLERVYAEAYDGAIYARNSSAEAFRAALLAVYRAGQDAAEIAARLDS